MKQAFFQEVCEYVEFSDADRQALRSLHERVMDVAHEIVDDFYERITRFPDAAQILHSPEQIGRLKVSLRNWLDLLLEGPWDVEYFRRRVRIGRMHVQVRLPQRYMFTAAAVIRAHLMALAFRIHENDLDSAKRAIHALARIIDIDLAIMLQAYAEDHLAAVQRVELAERQLVSKQLAISEARYQAVVESADIIVIAVDEAGNVILFNRRAEHVSGFARSDIIGKSWLETLCHPEHRYEVCDALELALRGQVVAPIEARIVTKDGREKWVRWHLTLMAGERGEPIAGAIGLEVTEEHELVQRTRRAENLAALGTLAAGLAHEIRNPLNAAQLQLTLVERKLGRIEGTEADSAQKAAELVRHELRRLGGLVQDFLDFARPVVLRLGSADLRETVRIVLGLLEPGFEEAGVELVSSLPEPVAARFDDERVKQVLINVLRNAMEATGPDGRVSVRLARHASTASVEIRDTGPGFPEGVNVFEPFTTTKESGTGLGLPIVHRIVSDHGGRIHYRRDGDETVLTIELPVDGPPS